MTKKYIITYNKTHEIYFNKYQAEQRYRTLKNNKSINNLKIKVMWL